MNPADKIKELINKSDAKTVSETDKRILGDALEHLEKLKQKKSADTGSNIFRVIFNSPTTRLAAAAIVLIAAGFVAGRLSAPRLLDVEQLQATLETSLKSSIEPAIRQDLLEEMNHQWDVSLASNRTQFKAEVRQILIDLIRAIDAVKTQDRRWIVEAMDQIELNRLRDKTRFINGLEALAVGTDTKLLRTKQDIAKLLVYSQPGGVVPEELKSLITSNENERSKE